MTISVCIRVDASQEIGSGHVIRCLTLATALRDNHIEVKFICRLGLGNMGNEIKSLGFQLLDLSCSFDTDRLTSYKDVSPFNRRSAINLIKNLEEEDAKQTALILRREKPNWIIVDHYNLGSKWESIVSSYVDKVMVIDDLGNRPHHCDIILDQNWNPNSDDHYANLIPPTCSKLLGLEYALLRKEFKRTRDKYYKRKSPCEQIFIFFGGGDRHNLTCRVLDALSESKYREIKVDVVIGSINAFEAEVKMRVNRLKNANLYIQVDDISELMINADLAIGSGGTATWERMCLGLPSLVVVTAKNHAELVRSLHEKKLITNIGEAKDLDSIRLRSIIENHIEVDPKNWTVA